MAKAGMDTDNTETSEQMINKTAVVSVCWPLVIHVTLIDALSSIETHIMGKGSDSLIDSFHLFTQLLPQYIEIRCQ